MKGKKEEGTIRAFVALPLSEEQRSEVARIIDPLRGEKEPVRWVREENFHVTLRFLGNLPPSQRAPLEDGMSGVAGILSPFRFRIGPAGAFPSIRRARVLWVGLTEGEEEVGALARKIEEAARRLGFEKEKRFHAHITVGRTKGPLSPSFRDRFTAISAGAIEAEACAFHLMKSTLTREGAIYEVLNEFPLGR